VVYVDHGISSAPDVSVSVAIRPEKIGIDRSRPAGSENIAHGRVKKSPTWAIRQSISWRSTRGS